MRDAVTLVAYLAALGCATFLAARGLLHSSVVATLLGAAVPTYWQHSRLGRKD